MKDHTKSAVGAGRPRRCLVSSPPPSQLLIPGAEPPGQPRPQASLPQTVPMNQADVSITQGDACVARNGSQRLLNTTPAWKSVLSLTRDPAWPISPQAGKNRAARSRYTREQRRPWSVHRHCRSWVYPGPARPVTMRAEAPAPTILRQPGKWGVSRASVLGQGQPQAPLVQG